MDTKGWIGVDLDGTLATYTGWKGVEHIGDPIGLMVDRVKRWLAQGKDVRIMTARICEPGSKALHVIEQWCLLHIGRTLPVTNAKDFGMIELWDDRVIQVEKNTGIRLSPP